jgi:hypothetical protein
MDIESDEHFKRLLADLLLIRYDGEGERYTDEEKKQFLKQAKEILMD